MIFLQDKIVIITGAGFSAPANLPIQAKILQEMINPTNENFLDADVNKESKKFLAAYIQVALYLLKEYTNIDTSSFWEEYNGITLEYNSNDRVLEVIKYIDKHHGGKAEEKNFNLMDVLDDTVAKCYLSDDDYYLRLLALKEKLREQLKASSIQISLEDVFTLFDKSIVMKENTTDYTYAEIDKLQHAVLRLFTYYFSNKVNEHTYDNQEYVEVIKYVREHFDKLSIITTNWDILLEEYFRKNELGYNYKFNSSYAVNPDGKIYNEQSQKIAGIPYLKIHGSINWFRCLRCGTLQINNADVCGKYLFEDNAEERCIKCGQTAVGESVQIKPEIITPTMMKEINGQLYNNLWQNAAYELQQADKIIFCGYSLPIADYEFRYLLKQNISTKTDIDVVLYHNDDPQRSQDDKLIDFLPEKRYRDLFPNNNCTFYYEGFGNYFQNINSQG